MSSAAPVKVKTPQPEGIQPYVLYKLVLFAILMAVVPIGTYFVTLNFAWDGKTTPSAICAVFAANIVLVSYVVVAFREEAAEAKAQKSTAPQMRKDQ